MSVEDSAAVSDNLADNGSRPELVPDKLHYLSKAGVAVLRGVSRQAIANAYDQAKLPEPAAYFDNGRPLWLPSQFETELTDAEATTATLDASPAGI